MSKLTLDDRLRAPEKTVGAQTRTLVVGPYRRRTGQGRRAPSDALARSRLEEAHGSGQSDRSQHGRLANVALGEIRPATYLGKGKVEEIAALVKDEEIDLVVMDCALSPVQQRNLEKAFKSKVIDRTGLILEIFGRRARTSEGVLQVELAHLDYQKSRLVRSWTHLERQRGGFGFLGGPGETQIETDRRLIQERMIRIERDLEGVKQTRALHRSSRSDVPYPIVALVGYTNAGKSTLFNRLTKAEVVAADMLFATLDPTMRALKLPHGGDGDSLRYGRLHLRSADHADFGVSARRSRKFSPPTSFCMCATFRMSDSEAQSRDVEAILGELGVAVGAERVIEVWNKLDKLDPEQRAAMLQGAGSANQPLAVSALTGEGTEGLLEAIESRLAQGRSLLDVELEGADGQGLHWLYENTEVMGRRTSDDGRIQLKVRVAPDKLARVTRRFGQAAAS